MGRRRQSDYHLPQRMRFKHGAYYYDHRPGLSKDGKRWENLGRDLSDAKLKWAKIEAERTEPESGTINHLWNFYKATELPELAKTTQLNRLRMGERLCKSFGHMRLDSLQPGHIADYLSYHPAKVAANREITLLSAMYTLAMSKYWVDHNPCLGVKRNKEKRRDRYIEDWEFMAVKGLASDLMQSIMDFAYLTGWRQGDILALHLNQISEEGIRVKTQKTGKKQVLSWTPALREVVERLRSARPNVAGFYLICSGSGDRYTPSGFKANWQRLMNKALKENVLQERFTFHDIRAKSGTDAEQQGKDPQKLLGHTTRKQTETYLRSKRVDYVEPVDPLKKAEL